MSKKHKRNPYNGPTKAYQAAVIEQDYQDMKASIEEWRGELTDIAMAERLQVRLTAATEGESRAIIEYCNEMLRNMMLREAKPVLDNSVDSVV